MHFRDVFLLIFFLAMPSFVSAQTVPNTHECFLQRIPCFASFDAATTIFTCRTDAGRYYDYYEFDVTGPMTVAITASSREIDPIVTLLIPRGAVLGSDDNGGGGTTARLVYTFSQRGTFAFTVTGVRPGSAGRYSVSLNCNAGTVNPPPPGGGPCGSVVQLCFQNRFLVEVDWRANGQAGRGTAVSISPDTGYFWFFNKDNVELVVKVLDGRPVNGHWWVFYGALTNVEYDIRVTDLSSGTQKLYRNPANNFGSVGDTQAFK